MQKQAVSFSVATLCGLVGTQAASTQITGITADSRQVKPGVLFAALPGTKADGRDFITEAVARGASAVLSTPDAAALAGDCPFISASNPRQQYARMAARWHSAAPAIQVAITGTNGKTSTAEFLRQIWCASDLEGASFGTLGLASRPLSVPGGLTSPDPMQLHASLEAAAAAGVTHVAVEASSHGLDQHRLDGMSLTAAGFTNLSRDHLDYHGSFEAYFQAKARLYTDHLPSGAAAVTVLSDIYADRMADLARGLGLAAMTVGTERSAKADISVLDRTLHPGGQSLSISAFGTAHTLDLPLVGSFQAENALLAAGLAVAAGLSADRALQALSSLVGVRGRMEYCGTSGRGGHVFVDYAHTPGGLETVLRAARAHSPRRLSVVFGCGGDRDRGKRSEMGRVAADLADNVFVTDDNPRSEDPAQIRRDVMAGCPDAAEIGDRGAAIEAAISGLDAGDMLIVAGKGHEEGQIIKETVVPHSDIGTVRALLGQQASETEGAP